MFLNFWLPFGAALLVKTLIVSALAGACLLLLRRSAAAARALVCLLALSALLLLPVSSLLLPGWGVPLPLPRRSAAPKPLSAPAAASVSADKPTVLPAEEEAAPALHAPVPANIAPRPFPWNAVLAFWLLGVCAAAVRPLLGLWGLARLGRDSVLVSDAAALRLCSDCAAALRVSRVPTLRRGAVPMPLTWGWRRPVVLLPDCADFWPEGRLRAVLLHELAHLRRRDWPAHRLADLACAFYWFHPCVWLLARRLRVESEIACDDLVLTTGLAAPDYARHLLEIALALPAAPASPQGAVAMAQTSRIERRLTMILDTSRRRTLKRGAWMLSAAAVLGAAGLASLHFSAQAAPPKTAKPKATKLEAKGITFHANSLTFSASNVSVVSLPSSAIDTGAVRAKFASDFKINGIQFLAGVTDANAPGGSWWSGTGAVLPSSLADIAVPPAGDQADKRTKNLVFVFHVPSPEITVNYKLSSALGYSSSNEADGSRTLNAAFPASATKTNLQIGLAFLPWKTVATTSGSASGTMAFVGATGAGGAPSPMQYISSPVTETKTGTVLTVSANSSSTSEDLRVVAVNAQGQEVLSQQSSISSNNLLRQATVGFALSLEQIKEIRVQTRPFSWIELKDVALKPVL